MKFTEKSFDFESGTEENLADPVTKFMKKSFDYEAGGDENRATFSWRVARLLSLIFSKFLLILVNDRLG